MLLRTSSQSLPEPLAVRFAECIQTQLLAPGTHQPSMRRGAMVRSSYPADPHARYALGN